MTQFRIPILEKIGWQYPVIEISTIPPLSPNRGDRYIVEINPEGDWVGHDNEIAFYLGTLWNFDTPSKGWVCWVNGKNNYYVYDGVYWRRKPLLEHFLKTTEIDFGDIPKSEQSFTILDADAKATSIVIGNVAYDSPTGKDLDEMEMDAIDLKFRAEDGRIVIYAKGLEGYLSGPFKVNYLIG